MHICVSKYENSKVRANSIKLQEITTARPAHVASPFLSQEAEAHGESCPTAPLVRAEGVDSGNFQG